eukprot:c4600_g1_i2.p1 GENE.c4600_g1_i2~~c4600_g1_i2.p1  ORF type:complete len:275 (+),score=45.92 c4600_g1_i2:123-947(+)
MPLVMMCGRPSTGKTTRALELATYLRETRGIEVVIVNEESLELDRNSCYTTQKDEKNFRGNIRSAIDRALAADVVVIADHMNYIKGFRYELFCAAKALSTPSCVLFCDVEFEVAAAWNAARVPETLAYGPALLEDLWSRFEVPNGMQRWDKPVFHCVGAESPTPCGDVAAHLLDSAAPRPNMATVITRVADASFVTELDRLTRQVVDRLIAWLSAGAQPGEPLPDTTLCFERVVTAAELRRIRKQYLSMTALCPTDLDRVERVFIQYLVSAVNS